MRKMNGEGGDGLKAQRVHSPGQGERSEATPWVGFTRMVRPIRGKSKKTPCLPHRTFALYRAQIPLINHPRRRF